MSVTLSITDAIQAVETLETNAVFLAGDQSVTHNFTSTHSLNSASDVPVTKVASFEVTMSSGTGSIDLTALPGVNGASISASGLKVQVLKVRNKSTNANAITVAKGASNGYTGFGSAWTITLQPGQWATLYGNEATTDVSGSVKVIDVTGTGSQVLECIVVAG